MSISTASSTNVIYVKEDIGLTLKPLLIKEQHPERKLKLLTSGCSHLQMKACRRRHRMHCSSTTWPNQNDLQSNSVTWCTQELFLAKAPMLTNNLCESSSRAGLRAERCFLTWESLAKNREAVFLHIWNCWAYSCFWLSPHFCQWTRCLKYREKFLINSFFPFSLALEFGRNQVYFPGDPFQMNFIDNERIFGIPRHFFVRIHIWRKTNRPKDMYCNSKAPLKI